MGGEMSFGRSLWPSPSSPLIMRYAIYIHTFTHSHIHTFTHSHIHTHTHTHTQAHRHTRKHTHTHNESVCVCV